MNFKKTVLITSIIATSLSGIAHAAIDSGNAKGTINFRGQFIDTTCTIEVNNTNKNEGIVQLGTWMTNTFDKVGEITEAVPLTIGLSGCPATLGRARVTFDGTPHADNNKLYAVNSAGGVGIGISGDVNGTNFYTPGTEADGIDLKGNHGEKTYYARYVTTANEVTPGKANADVTVTIQYNQ
ncbi:MULTISPECIES: fimbrial protein [Providencia]|uniref:fimbrial protein n=1 Tax=Providencia TaxID=586 RepID=UPI001C5BB9FE|nr:MULTISPECIES: fimbrial protein [Providencia]ELR5150428.1 fimbrial protein [Providencia rettgeri]QXX83035.1 fimbrial protein [Providencia sp. R33]